MQELVTKDNVTVRVNGVTSYVVRDATKAVLSVQDYRFATAQKAQVTLLRAGTGPSGPSSGTAPGGASTAHPGHAGRDLG